MKKYILFFTLLALSFGLQLRVDSRLVLENSYQLQCDNAQGQVIYQVQNLPSGVVLNGNTIKITSQQAVNGYYPVRVRARDAAGQQDERVVVIVVRRTTQQQSNIQNQNTQATGQQSQTQALGV